MIVKLSPTDLEQKNPLHMEEDRQTEVTGTRMNHKETEVSMIHHALGYGDGIPKCIEAKIHCRGAAALGKVHEMASL